MKQNKKKVIYIAFFLFYLLICFLNPIAGDDWWNYPIGKNNLIYIIDRSIEMYFTWEGRFISRILISILTYQKAIWNFLNATIITSIIYLINKNIKGKKLFPFLLSILLLTAMHPYVFFQTVTWVAGNITYMFILPAIIYYVYLITKDKITNLEYAILAISSTFGTMFIENTALIIVFLNMIYLIADYIKNKKINYKIVILLFLSLLTTTLMVMSPGSRGRALTENVEFNNLNIIQKIKWNYPKLIKYTYFTNLYMVILMIFGNILIIKNKIKNKILRIVLYIFEILQIICPILYLLDGVKIYSNTYFNEYNHFVIIFYTIGIVFNLLLLLMNNKKIFEDKPIIFYSIGILSNVVMLVSPVWGPRTSLGTYILVSICYIIIISNYIKKVKLLNCIVVILITGSMLFYGIISVSIYRQYLENKKIVEKGIENNSDTIAIKAYPEYVMNSLTPNADFHKTEFKKYYNIDPKTKIEIIPNDWKYSIIYK